MGGIIIRILCYGSLNVDYVYKLDHFVQSGETISADNLELFCGGKGLNQSIALARAGASVYHAGKIGNDGEALAEMLQDSNVNTDHISRSESKSGHAIIQVNKSGQNCIILYAGANKEITENEIDAVLEHFTSDDLILLQNETNNLGYMIEKSYSKGITIALNASPINEAIGNIPLHLVTYFFVNEIEGEVITGESKSERITSRMIEMFPDAKIILTLGRHGVEYRDRTDEFHCGIYDVPVVDTTAAGDTFTGYFIASLAAGAATHEALRTASAASSLSVSRKGAAASIPAMHEVREFMGNNSTI
ncbi:MAG: ribokinase [Saccharofermentanales bacterium]